MIDKIKTTAKRTPVGKAAVVRVVTYAVMILVSMKYITPENQELFIQFGLALVALLEGGLFNYQYKRVTPVSDPRDSNGVPLVPLPQTVQTVDEAFAAGQHAPE